MNPTFYLLILLLLLSPTFPNFTQANKSPHIIKFRSPGLYPEGLTYDPNSQHFIVGSLYHGTFHSVSDAGVIETLTLTPTLTLTLTPDTTSFSHLPPNSTILGLTVDRRNNRLLAAVNTPSPHLAAFTLHRSSLSPLFLAPLPGTDNIISNFATDNNNIANDLANDVTVDPHGNAYITNSNNNLIWKVTINGTATILSQSPLFSHYPVDPTDPYNYCGLNGIVYIPTKEYLLSIQSNTGKLFKIDTIDGTSTTVTLPEPLTHGDGITVRDDGIIVVTSMNNAWLLKSDDSWSSGVVIDKIALDRDGFPTSVTIGGGKRVYVVYGYVEEGMKVNSQTGERIEEREWFRIEEVKSQKESDGESLWPFLLVGLGLAYFMFWRFQMGQLARNMDRKIR